MRIAKLVSIAFVAGVAASNSTALAQAPAGATMLVPGVYTTPEISTKCQAYARQRVGGSSHNDNSRQAIALACAQKLWKHELAKGKG